MKIMSTLFKSFITKQQLLQKLIYNFYDQKPLKVIKTPDLVYLKKTSLKRVFWTFLDKILTKGHQV